MNLCFDVVCVFQHAFGELPDQANMDDEWLEKSAALLNAELQAFRPNISMDKKFQNKLQERIVERLDRCQQKNLIQFLETSIDYHVSNIPASDSAIRMTKSMINVVVHLFNTLYEEAGKCARAGRL